MILDDEPIDICDGSVNSQPRKVHSLSDGDDFLNKAASRLFRH